MHGVETGFKIKRARKKRNNEGKDIKKVIKDKQQRKEEDRKMNKFLKEK